MSRSRSSPGDGAAPSEERLRYALSATNDGLWDWDLVSGLAYLSPRYYELTGYRAEEVVPDLEFFRKLMHPDDWPRAWAVMAAHLEGRTAQSEFDYRMICRDGAVRWMLGRGRVVARDAAGRPLRMIGTITDITERKRQQEELRLQAEVMANMAEGVALVSAATGRLLYVNPRYEEMLGYGRGELVGRHVSAVNAPGEMGPERVAEAIIAELDRKGTWRGEVENRRKDGTTIWCRSSVSTFDHADYGLVWVGVNSDITEARLARRERDEATGALRSLAAHVRDSIEDERRAIARDVHDQIGAALTGIGMKLDALARCARQPACDCGHAVARIRRRVDEAQLAAREICTRLRPPLLDDLGLAEACRWYVRDWSHQTGIRVVTRLAVAEPAGGAGLRTDLFRILQELLTNVARHAGATEVVVGLSVARQALVLRVRDNGRGFGAAGGAKPAGFGLLGLRERAQRHGGEVAIESDGGGTRVTVRLPLAEGKA